MTNYVECIDNTVFTLTIGKIYKVVNELPREYAIVNPAFPAGSTVEFYPKRLFVEVKEENKKENIMSKKLEIKLFRYGTLVFGKVIHQDKDLKLPFKYGGFEILSDRCPQLTTYNILHVRGTDTEDDNSIFHYKFLKEDDAIRLSHSIKNAVDALNDSSPKIATDDSDIFEIL